MGYTSLDKNYPEQTEMLRSDSNGILDLAEGETRRKQGASLIARKIELENMKQR